jgi:hypothetical protein
VAEFAARDTGRETVVADGDLLVDELVREVVRTLCHSTHENANTLLGLQTSNVLADFDEFGIETQSDLSAVGRQVVCDGILDDLEKLLLRRCRSDGESVEELDHETCEAFKCTGNSYRRADFDKDTFRCVDVNLQLASLVDRRVKESKEALCRVSRRSSNR